jgi:hypothetical protein
MYFKKCEMDLHNITKVLKVGSLKWCTNLYIVFHYLTERYPNVKLDKL